MDRAKYEERVRSFLALSECAPLLESLLVCQHRSSLNSVLLGLYGGFITYTQLIESLAIGG